MVGEGMTLQHRLSSSDYNYDDPNNSHLKSMTPYEQLNHLLTNDQRCLKEMTLGKRVGFYRIKGDLGSGNFSQVKVAVNSLTREKVAVKILDKTKLDQKTQRLLSREITSMEKLKHPNIVRLYEVIETLAKLNMIMEYAPHGELFTKISSFGRLTDPECRSTFCQIVSAVSHMHKHDIIHRDLKAENIFYSGRVVKVGDFGFSTVSHVSQPLNTFCGSPPYAAPELFKDEHYEGRYVDIWALGILLYFMIAGVMPFRAETVGKLKKCIIEGTFTIPSFVSEKCQYIIRGILKKPPKDRLSLEKIERSSWLEGQKFPESLHDYEMFPHAALSSTGSDEQETTRILRDLGITAKVINESKPKEVRSSITGVYRIVLHRVQKQRYPHLSDGSTNSLYLSSTALSKRNSTNTINSTKSYPGKKQESKFCTIL